MRLSEAISLGRNLVRPEAYKLSSCALGMGLLAIGKQIDYGQVSMAWPWTNQAIPKGPCICEREDEYYMSAIAHVFDKHVMGDETWTLEQLVDWIRSVEPVETQEQFTQKIIKKEEKSVCV